MSRDSNGNYTLPAGNPVVADTLIDVDWANPTMSDIASALTDSLSRTGKGGMQAPLEFDDGTVAAPGITWTNATSSGWYRAGTNDFRYSIAGVDVLKMTAAAFAVYQTATFSKAVNFTKGADIASAATIDLSAATGNLVHVTGTTAITAVTLASGEWRNVVFDGVLTLTHHATTNNLPGAANITTAAGDRAVYWSDGTTVYCTMYQRASSAPMPVLSQGQIIIGESSGNLATVSSPLGGAQIINGKISLSVGSSALTVALKGLDGNNPSATNPVFIKVPQNTAGVFDGTYAIRKVTSALSVVVSSGSTLGHTSAVACPVYFYLIDNAGTPELAVSTKYFGTPAVVSTTAEGGAGAADSQTVIYSTTGRSNVSAACIGRWKSTQTTAGTWAAVTGEQQLYPFPYKAPTFQQFTASGTYTRPWDLLSAKVLSVGGGGGGGGGGVATSGGGASGGGAGGAAITYLDATEMAASEVITIGAAGAGGVGNAAGGSGGSTGFSGSNLCNASGGSAGQPGVNLATVQGVSGGNGTNGDTLFGGGDSGWGWHSNLGYAVGGKGGDSIFAGGGLGGHLGNNGNAGHSYGAGGGGASVAGGATAGTGGSGVAGYILVEEFYQ